MKSSRSRAVFAVAFVALLGGCFGEPPPKVKFAGKSYARGVVATEKGRESFLYTIPGQGLSQDSRLGMITSTTETPAALQTWIMGEYVKAMGAGRVLEETPTPTSACKVGQYGGRSFVALHVCVAAGKRAGCLELDEKVANLDASRAADLCNEWRGKYEAELAGLAPVILAKM